MQTWDLAALDVRPHQPEVITSDDEGRAIVIELPSGEEMGEHQVHERAWVLVVSGEIELSRPNGESVSGGPGLLAAFEPNERHEVRARADSRLLLMLSPWPGIGHPSTTDRAAPSGP